MIIKTLSKNKFVKNNARGQGQPQIDCLKIYFFF